MGKFLLTFVRHGETEWNVESRLQGQTDIPLNETGLQQADQLGRYLATEKFDRIYSSDLSRCLQTANGLLKHAAIQRPDIILDARLRERHFGSHEGMTKDEREQKGLTGVTPPGGETFKQVVRRGISFIHDMCEDVHKAYFEDRAPVSHSQPIRCPENLKQPITYSESDAETSSGLAANAGGTSSDFEVVFSEGNGESNGKLAENESKKVDNHTAFSIGRTNGSKGSNKESTDGSPDGISSSMLNTMDGTSVEKLHTSSAICGTIMSENKTCDARTNENTSSFANSAKYNVHKNASNFVLCAKNTNSTSEDASGFKSESTVFKSHITGALNAPPNCPHIFVSSHGFILRNVIKKLQRDYKIDIPGDAKNLHVAYPNTGISSFIVDLDCNGEIADMECLFVCNTDHLAS